MEGHELTEASSNYVTNVLPNALNKGCTNKKSERRRLTTAKESFKLKFKHKFKFMCYEVDSKTDALNKELDELEKETDVEEIVLENHQLCV